MGGLQIHLAPSVPGLSMSWAVKNKYCGQVSANTLCPCPRARVITSTPSAVETWKIMIGWSRKAANVISRLNAAASPMAHRVEFRRRVAALHQPLADPRDHAVVLGMHAHERAVLLGGGEHVE